MRIKKTFKVEMIVKDNLRPEEMKTLVQIFNAEVIESILFGSSTRPPYVKYKVEEIEEETQITT